MASFHPSIAGNAPIYIASDDRAFEVINYGFELNPEEQRRRFILLSLLSDQGLDLAAYRDRFHSDSLLG